MKKIISIFVFAAIILLAKSCSNNNTYSPTVPKTFTITKTQLLDKIKGGWAGQTIGCTYGGPTEFRYNGTMIQDYIPIIWTDGYIKHWYEHTPGLYDDIYMDLTFVDVFARLGIDAPADSLAMAFATAGYTLWHANQSARYNILNGIMPPQSGHWLNNPHADDLDYQIEADYAGIMSPGMPNTASEISDKVGHIMNYGDGWYGGVYVGAIYTLAFISNDIEFIVTEALKTIPEQSTYYKCMSDVIKWHKQFPDDWKQTWFECEKKWSSDIGCPDGVFVPFNIDALINSAYILTGLLYGEGDFYKSMDIATRCGQDSDCNPASVAGILGVILGYDNIPEYWMKNLKEVEDMNFAYTDISLSKAYQMSFDQAVQVIEREGGNVDGENIAIACQQPIAVNYEKSFDGLYPVENRELRKKINDIGEFVFAGTGVVFRGNVSSGSGSRNNNAPFKNANYAAKILVSIDGKAVETVNMPADYRTRRNEIFWKYQLPNQTHTVTFKWLNPEDGVSINFRDVIIYSDKPYLTNHQSNKN
ncbi:MAG: ADP-ribosylglycohydrolase family protein [Prevotellaceae bacterium]|nr:ADP-ribosylglycohydrolase family protein [Prevotellaceae bacterium]